VSYSQNEEEKYILQAVARIQPGHFLDIGAWNAKDLSNTRALFEKGWSGVLVEPSPEPFLGILKEYGKEDRIELLLAGVGRNSAITRFHATADALTTSNVEQFEKWKGTGGFYGSFHAPIVTVKDIFDRFGRADFVSIDAEGSSVDLLHDVLASDMDPLCICVEYDNRNQEAIDAATAKGYTVLYTSAENLVLGR
jgi:hypothetical protein